MGEVKKFQRSANDETVLSIPNLSKDWLEAKHQLLLMRKFGNDRYDISYPRPTAFTDKNLRCWAAYNLHPVYFPKEIVDERWMETAPPGWVKPNQAFYQLIDSGRLSLESFRFSPGWYLADFTPLFIVNENLVQAKAENDPFAPILQAVRESGYVASWKVASELIAIDSRYIFTANEWFREVLPAMAKKFGVEDERVRLERAIEFNWLANLYDPWRGNYPISQWFYDTMKPRSWPDWCLIGGNFCLGGVAHIEECASDKWSSSITARPLIKF